MLGRSGRRFSEITGDIGRNPRWRSIRPGCDVGVPVASAVVPTKRVELVKHSTANVMSTIVRAVSIVRKRRLRMFAMPSTTALNSTLARAKLAPSLLPRPERTRFSSVSNFP